MDDCRHRRLICSLNRLLRSSNINQQILRNTKSQMNHSTSSQLDQNKLIQLVTEMVLGKLTSHSGHSHSKENNESQSEELPVNQKLVTTDSLPSGWRTSKNICFARQTIVTPAVFDLLRDHGVSYSRSSVSTDTPKSGSSNNWVPTQVNPTTRGAVVLDQPITPNFGWLEKVCHSFQLSLVERNPTNTLENGSKHLLLSEQPFGLQKRLTDTGHHAIVGCKDFSETFDRMAFSNLLIMPISTASWTLRQILKSWDHLGCLAEKKY